MQNTVRFNESMFEALTAYIATRDVETKQREAFIERAVQEATDAANSTFNWRMDEAKRTYERAFQCAAYDQDQLARNLDNELICILKNPNHFGTAPLIKAIKLHRERTGAGLKESKDYCDALVVEIKRGLDSRD